MKTLLIDADGVAFSVAAACQRGIRWDDDIITSHVDLNECKESFQAVIRTYEEAVEEPCGVILCYSCPTRHYFRHDILPTYKGNRKGNAPPLGLRALIDWSKEEYDFKVKPNLEADDVMGILATVKGAKTIIVSIDKDMKQIPGLHLNARTPSEGVFRVSPEFAEFYLWMQVLTGDQVDGYTGIPGCGPKTAEKILLQYAPPNQMYDDIVLNAYKKAGLTAEDMAVQVNVARILTAQTYNFKRKEPILWQM